MKTGNAIMASFFWFMALTMPFVLIFVCYEHIQLIQYLPFGFDVVFSAIISFIVLLSLGIVAMMFGIEWKRKKNVEEYFEVDIEPEKKIETKAKRIVKIKEDMQYPTMEEISKML